MAGVVTDIVRYDVGSVRGYLLHCERSSGKYLHQALLDTGQTLGAVPATR